LITTCSACRKLYEAAGDEAANEPGRTCPTCWLARLERELRAAMRAAAAAFGRHQADLTDLGPSFWVAVDSLTLAADSADDACDLLRIVKQYSRRLGAPGDFGYGRSPGEDLRRMYDAATRLSEARGRQVAVTSGD
jgi:hypothetical protein